MHRTHIRCDSCSRRYPVTVVQRGATNYFPRGWSKSGSKVVCKKCTSKATNPVAAVKFAKLHKLSLHV